MDEKKFTASEVDAMYFAGVFLSGGLNALSSMVQNYSKRGVLPHELLELCQKAQEKTQVETIMVPFNPDEFQPIPGKTYIFKLNSSHEKHPSLWQNFPLDVPLVYVPDPSDFAGCEDCDAYTLENGCCMWTQHPKCMTLGLNGMFKRK